VPATRQTDSSAITAPDIALSGVGCRMHMLSSPPNLMADRTIFHVDMDAFYASVEVRERPELRGRPVIVGGTHQRGVVSTASYEARKFGVHSAMPMARAIRICPQAVVLPVRMHVYAQVSEQIMQILGAFSPLVEPLSLDEAFLDMTGTEGLHGSALQAARAIKTRIREVTRLTASVGVACNKFLAKLASDLDKPDGLTVVPRGREIEFIAPLPVRRLWGVGPRTASHLEASGLLTIGDIACADPTQLARRLGPSLARHILALAHARDDRPVVPWHDARSIGSEETFERDIRGKDRVLPVLRRHSDRVARRLRARRLVAGAVRVKVRYSRTFRLATREGPLPQPSDDSETLMRAAVPLLDRFDWREPIRLVGLAAADLRDQASPMQPDMFDHARARKQSMLEHTLDALRERFGDSIIRKGCG